MATGVKMTAVLRSLQRDECIGPDVLAKRSGVPRHEAIKVVGKLIGRGFAERAEVGCYRLTADGEARLASGQKFTSGPNGKLAQAARRPKRSTFRDRLWSAMRVSRKFSVPELIELAATGGKGEGADGARRFVCLLARTGVLMELPRRMAGTAMTSNGFKRYTLVRDLGPATPIVRSGWKSIHDPNSGQDMEAENV